MASSRSLVSLARSRRRLTVAVAAVLLVAAATAGVVIAEQAPPASQPTSFTPSRTTSAAAIPLVDALANALKSMPASSVVDATVGAPPAGEAAAARPNQPWLYETVDANSVDNGEAIEPLWRADLIEGAMLEQASSSADLHDALGGASFTIRLPDGSTVDGPSGVGDVVHGQAFPAPTDATAVAQIKATLKSYGLTAISVSILHPLSSAVAVVASTSDESKTLPEFGAIRDALFGNPPTFEGYYFELRDASGNPLVRASADFRDGAGRFWVNPTNQADVGGEVSLGGASPTR